MKLESPAYINTPPQPTTFVFLSGLQSTLSDRRKYLLGTSSGQASAPPRPTGHRGACSDEWVAYPHGATVHPTQATPTRRRLPAVPDRQGWVGQCSGHLTEPRALSQPVCLQLAGLLRCKVSGRERQLSLSGQSEKGEGFHCHDHDDAGFALRVSSRRRLRVIESSKAKFCRGPHLTLP